MTPLKKYSISTLLVRTLEPSWFAAVSMVVVAAVLVIGHVGLLRATSQNSALYPNQNLQVFNLTGWGLATNCLLWILIGWVVLAGLQAIADISRRLGSRQNSSPIQKKMTVVRVVWRSGCLLGFVALALLAQVLIRSIIKIDAGVSSGQAASNLIKSVGLWMILEYCALLLLRLYMFRTRVFGEILY